MDPLDRISPKESLTNRRITISTVLNPANLAKCHTQTQSPLFQLRQELRNSIFILATATDPDANQLYNEAEPWYQPDQTAKPRHNASLLATCRRAWLETNVFPLADLTHTFWAIKQLRRPR